MTVRRAAGAASVLALAAALLAGCAPASESAVTFRLWDPQAADAYEASFEEFREETGVPVDVELVPWADYWTQLRVDIASGAAPDVFWTNATAFPEYQRAGRLLPIGSVLGSDAADGWEPRVVEQYTADGELWGVPQLTDPGIGIFYNADALAAAGVTADQVADLSWDPAAETDPLREVAAALTRDAAGQSPGKPGFDPERVEQWGYSASNDLNAILLQFLGSNGAAWQDGDEFVFDSPAAVEALAYVVDLINADRVAPPASATNPPAGGDAARDLFLQGRIALFQTGAYNLANIAEAAPFDWGIAPLPAGPAGAISVTNGVVAAASADSDAPDEQRRVLEWIASPEGLRHLGADGSALPAVLDAQDAYFGFWADQGVDVSPLLDVLDNGMVQPPQGADYPAAENAYRPILNEVFAGREPVEEGLRRAAAAANEAMRRDG
ncbi:sugar ABC transporter substrate-binding protein [Naasia sp. SYSU D00948]|uniref:ABC transporter substrate-binding protein n=1 Tax=Naasia sp. SYSU D00948 TaxID=2817379 RepID=UPI001B31276A|nr:sugar ABC transporter substrate-binding protein [Naasia sp. SYSU D00948]